MIRIRIEMDHGYGTIAIEELGSLPQDAHDEAAALRALAVAVARAKRRAGCALVARDSA